MKFRDLARIGLVVMSCLCGAGRPALADTDAPELLRRAIKLYKVGEFPRSLRLLHRARRAAEAAPAASRDPSTLARIYLHIGLNHGAYGRDDAALHAFGKALTQDPTLRLRGPGIKPRVAALFVRARQGLEARLVLTCDQPQARLTLNGEERGILPFRGSLPAGPHSVAVHTPKDWFGHKRQLTLKPGETRELHLTLAPVAGKVTVTSRP